MSQDQTFVVNQSIEAIDQLTNLFATRKNGEIYPRESQNLLKIVHVVLASLKKFKDTTDNLVTHEEHGAAVDKFAGKLLILMMQKHDVLKDIWLDDMPASLGKYKFTSLLRYLCVVRMLIYSSLVEWREKASGDLLPGYLSQLEEALVAAGRFQGFSTKAIYNQLHKEENCMQLLWTLFHFSTCFELTSEMVDTIQKAVYLLCLRLVKFVGIQQKPAEWNYKGLSNGMNLQLEDLSVLIYYWQRAVALVRTKLQIYCERAQTELKQNFRSYINRRFGVVMDNERCAATDKETWHVVCKMLGRGKMTNKQTQDFQKLVFSIMLAPGLAGAYLDITAAVAHPIAASERMLDETLLRASAFFTATPLNRIAAGYLDPGIVAFDPEQPKKPFLPSGIETTDYIYKKICILAFVMQLEKLLRNSRDIDGGFLDTFFLINPDPTQLYNQPCRIIYLGSCFYMTNQKCELLRLSHDKPGWFAWVYLHEVQKLTHPIAKLICNGFKAVLST